MLVSFLRGAKNRGARDQGVGAGAGDLGDVIDFHATIDFQQNAATAALGIGVDFLLGQTQLVERFRNEFLSAKTRPHRHKKHHINLFQPGLNVCEFLVRVNRETYFFAKTFNLSKHSCWIFQCF